MKLRKLTAMLLSFALASVSFVSTVSAENAGKVDVDPKITVTTTVASIDDGLATIQVDIDSDVFEAATKSGLNYANVNGIMGWQYAIQLNDEFFAAEDPDYMAIVEDVGMIAKGDSVVDLNVAKSILLYTVDQFEIDGENLTAADANLYNIVDVNDGTTILLYTVDQYELTSN
jgi:hypothetical protein